MSSVNATSPEAGATTTPDGKPALDFIRSNVTSDLSSGRFQKVHTRFPPEPNGYLHIGHAKAICTDFGVAAEFGGKCNLRFDDTNPAKEEQEYVDAIEYDVRWLGFDWEDRLFYASDYFHQLYDWAVLLINKGLAYVEDLPSEEISKGRGTPTEPGVNSPSRSRPVAENLRLFEEMKAGKHPEGSLVLRAKIDMAHPNLTMRDPVMYRIKFDEHHRTGKEWCIYPMYDWAHGQSDAIEGVSHSICTLEFENHRPLYEWYLEAIGLEHRPRQMEFSRLNLSYTMMSKRKLLELVELGLVNGWNDPRMPTISGLRRRGYSPEAIRAFVGAVGLSKTEGMIELAMLEYYVRADLNKKSRRVMVVLDPVKLQIENWPAGKVEYVDVENNPEDPLAGNRKVAFSGELFVERDDFRAEASKDWFRLAPGATVRLKGAGYLTCTGYTTDSTGKLESISASFRPMNDPEINGKKVKGTIHWLSAAHCLDVEVRQYDTLFTLEDLNRVPEGKDYKDFLNPASLVVLESKAETALAEARVGDSFQFLRQGYYCPDNVDHVSVGTAAANALTGQSPDHCRLVFNRTVTLKDTWSKLAKKQ